MTRWPLSFTASRCYTNCGDTTRPAALKNWIHIAPVIGNRVPVNDLVRPEAASCSVGVEYAADAAEADAAPEPMPHSGARMHHAVSCDRRPRSRNLYIARSDNSQAPALSRVWP